MWDRMQDPREAERFMRTLVEEVRQMRLEMQEVLRMAREAEFVRKRLEYERPGYWDDSVRLERVRKRIGDAL